MTRQACAADTAFVRNSSAWAYAEATETPPRIRVQMIREWRPTAVALKPSRVFAEIGLLTSGRGVDRVMADSHYRESFREGLDPYRVALIPTPSEAWRPFEETRFALIEDYLDLTPLPKDVLDRLSGQLAKVRASDGSKGSLRITQETTKDGAHGDLVSALVLVVWQLRFVRTEVRALSGRLVRRHAPRDE